MVKCTVSNYACMHVCMYTLQDSDATGCSEILMKEAQSRPQMLLSLVMLMAFLSTILLYYP